MESTRSTRLRLLLAAAIVSALAVVWAATALAGGSGSSPASKPAGKKPVASHVKAKSRSNNEFSVRSDCPGKNRPDATSADL